MTQQVDIYDVIKTKPAVKNAFTGEPYVKSTPETIYQETRQKGLALQKRELAELKEYGEPHPITGELQKRPKAIGRSYDIPPADGTHCADQVDRTGAEAVDINLLMKKWDPSGRQFNNAIAQGLTTTAGMHYDDFTDSKTLQQALEISIHAEEQFAMLPAELRNRFENQPGRFLDFVNDPKTLEEQYKLGIRAKKVEPEKDATLKDVVKAVQETAKTKKPAPKGGEGDE